MSTEPPARPPDDAEGQHTQPLGAEPTQQMSPPPGSPPPPAPTQPMYAQSGPPSRPGGAWVVGLLLLIVGLGAGFVLAQFLENRDARLPSEDLVLFEPASSTFPLDGAQFTQSTFEPQTGECNRESLKQYLRADSTRMKAWLELQEVEEAGFDDFVDGLETRILRGPTSVTNYGCFADGPCPFSIQSVLAAGTPVWWDPAENRFIAKCACSNPIKAPRCPPNCESEPAPGTQEPEKTPTAQATFTPTPSVEPSVFPTDEPIATPEETEPVDCTEDPNDPACRPG